MTFFHFHKRCQKIKTYDQKVLETKYKEIMHSTNQFKILAFRIFLISISRQIHQTAQPFMSSAQKLSNLSISIMYRCTKIQHKGDIINVAVVSS